MWRSIPGSSRMKHCFTMDFNFMVPMTNSIEVWWMCHLMKKKVRSLVSVTPGQYREFESSFFLILWRKAQKYPTHDPEYQLLCASNFELYYKCLCVTWISPDPRSRQWVGSADCWSVGFQTSCHLTPRQMPPPGSSNREPHRCDPSSMYLWTEQQVGSPKF